MGINQSLILSAKILYGWLTIAEGFDKSDNMPTIVDGDGGIQGRLAPTGDTVTYGFE